MLIEEINQLVHQLDFTARPVTEDDWLEAAHRGYVSVKHDGGRIVGFGWIFPRKTLLRKTAVIEDMIVDSSQRGKGLGMDILNDLIDWAREQKIEVIELTTHSSRKAANALYQKAGFKQRETNVYHLKL